MNIAELAAVAEREIDKLEAHLEKLSAVNAELVKALETVRGIVLKNGTEAQWRSLNAAINKANGATP